MEGKLIKKIIIILFLLIFIALTLSFSVFYYFFNLSKPDNYINNSYRKIILSNHLLRTVFRLDQVGDARFDYAVNKNLPKLKIIIYHQIDNNLMPDTMKTVIGEIKKVIEKPVEISVIEKSFPGNLINPVSDEKLKTLVKANPADWPVFGNTAVLQIFLLGRYTAHPTYAGLVKDSENIFLFMDSIKDISDYQASTEKAETSTIMHEFAHLLGAGHVNDKNCILAGTLENLDEESMPTYFYTSYCDADLEEINRALSL